ncbi:hypothetical protein F8M41_014596 [Gigaspora margarita]|uniref:Uncharacterized protein n=1 Tax=Gigaspora margarita TaxID=4874 RepID=A0A8H4EVX6_GIGMA|nr:hypothetical protein F8M41_014596 [Gigaspora margarita]
MSEFEEMIIEIDQTKPHNGITELLLSPNGEYAVTWSRDDKSICGWQINNLPISNSISCGKDVVDCHISEEGKIMFLDRCGSLTQ